MISLSSKSFLVAMLIGACGPEPRSEAPHQYAGSTPPNVLDVALRKVTMSVRPIGSYETQVNANELTRFLDDVRSRAEKSIGRSRRPLRISIYLGMTPEGHTVDLIGFRPNQVSATDAELVQEFVASFNTIDLLHVKGRVAFTLKLTVSP